MRLQADDALGYFIKFFVGVKTELFVPLLKSGRPTPKLTGGNEAQRNCRPVECLESPLTPFTRGDVFIN
jgi:hypothetical protein